MTVRFRKRIKIAPGLSVNIGKSGVSTTIGPPGTSITIGEHGVYANIGLPGTGISFRKRIDTLLMKKQEVIVEQQLKKDIQMTYTAAIDRANPTVFLFLIDQSGSMEDTMPTGRSKAQQLSDVLNRTLTNLIVRSTKSEGVRNYFEIGVLAYGGSGVYNGFQGSLSSKIIHPISEIEASPLRIEERKKKVDDGAGGLIEQVTKFPVWFEPQSGGGTPMCEAITRAAEELAVWCDAHPDSYPPTILHITDGESTDGDPEPLAAQLGQIQTNDGSVLIFNLHVSSSGVNSIEFPSSELALPNDFAKMLFRASSRLPEHLIRFAQEKGFSVGIEAKGFMFNADAVQLVDFFDIGTRASQLR